MRAMRCLLQESSVRLIQKTFTTKDTKVSQRTQRTPMRPAVKIIGAGLAGSEAAWQCARRGVAVDRCEMRPVRSSSAHQPGEFAELICSNSLKADSENTAPW